MMPEKLPFRPLDNSSSTQMRYNLEYEHWAKAKKSYEIGKPSVEILNGGSVFSLMISLGVSVMTLIIMIFYVVGKKLLK